MQTLGCGRALPRLADQGTNLNVRTEEKEGIKNKPLHKITFTQNLTFCLTAAPPTGTGEQGRDTAQTGALHTPPETLVSLFPLGADSPGADRPSWAHGGHTEGAMPTSAPHKAFQRGTGPPHQPHPGPHGGVSCHYVTHYQPTPQGKEPLTHHSLSRQNPASSCHAGHLHQPTRRGWAQHSCEQPQLRQGRQPSQVSALSSTALLTLPGRVCLLQWISNSSKNTPPNCIFLLLKGQCVRRKACSCSGSGHVAHEGLGVEEAELPCEQEVRSL